jgi:uncharacterized membrane protein
MKKAILILLTLCCVFSSGLSYAAVRYTLIDLGTNGYGASYANAINNNGVIAGEFGVLPGETPKLFKWEDTVFTELPYSGDEIYSADAFAINDLNEIVGAETRLRPTAVMWDADNAVTPINTWSVAMDINNRSQVVCGTWELRRTLLWDDGELIEIASRDLNNIDYSWPHAINDKAKVVGEAYRYDVELLTYNAFPFLWEDGVVIDLNDLMDYRSRVSGLHLNNALDINNYRQIIGCYGDNDKSYLFSGNKVRTLGFKGATAINDRGQIVGSHYLYENLQIVIRGGELIDFGIGFLYDLNNLIDSDVVYDELEVEDINNSGQIVGSAVIDGAIHAVLLNPPSIRRIPLAPPVLRIVQ